MTVLIASSAWIEYIRRTGSATNLSVRQAVQERSAATTDAVRLEVLAGSYQGPTPGMLTAMLDGCSELAQEPRTDVEVATDIYHLCRRAGETIRSLNDCLIAAIAIRNDVPVLHRDRDFDVVARLTSLQVSTG